MVTLDRIRIKVPISVLGGQARHFKQTSPYLVSITTHRDGYAYIMFTAKILLDGYPDLINRNNIVQCLERVRHILNINFDIDSVLREGVITSCDFTKDVPLCEMEGVDNNIHRIKHIIRLTNPNHQVFSCDVYRNGSVTVKKAVQSPMSKYRITFYNKEKEYHKKKNEEFRHCLSIDGFCQQLFYFQGKVRIEVNAYTSSHIKEWLHISDTRIMTVLEAEENPIRNAIKEVFVPINISEEHISQRTQDKIALLKGMKWDMSAVEAIVKEHDPNNWSRQMKPYRELCLKYSPDLNSIPTLDISNWV